MGVGLILRARNALRCDFECYCQGILAGKLNEPIVLMQSLAFIVAGQFIAEQFGARSFVPISIARAATTYHNCRSLVLAIRQSNEF